MPGKKLGEAVLTKTEASQRVGEAMGRSKFNSYMSGAMMPKPYVRIADVLGWVYGRDPEVIQLILESWCEREFLDCQRKQREAFEKRHGKNKS